MGILDIPHVTGVTINADEDGTGEVGGVTVVHTDLQTDATESGFDAHAYSTLEDAIQKEIVGKYQIVRG